MKIITLLEKQKQKQYLSEFDAKLEDIGFSKRIRETHCRYLKQFLQKSKPYPEKITKEDIEEYLSSPPKKNTHAKAILRYYAQILLSEPDSLIIAKVEPKPDIRLIDSIFDIFPYPLDVFQSMRGIIRKNKASIFSKLIRSGVSFQKAQGFLLNFQKFLKISMIFPI